MSCLFDSLSYYFNVRSDILRNEICNYLEHNAPLFDDIPTNVVLDVIDKDYIAKMRERETWGGGIEISAACNIWKLVIVVHSHHMKPVIFEPLDKKYTHIIHLLWTGNHYEPIRTINS